MYYCMRSLKRKCLTYLIGSTPENISDNDADRNDQMTGDADEAPEKGKSTSENRDVKPEVRNLTTMLSGGEGLVNEKDLGQCDTDAHKYQHTPSDLSSDQLNLGAP